MIRPDVKATTTHIRNILQPVFWTGCATKQDVRDTADAFHLAIDEEMRTCLSRRNFDHGKPVAAKPVAPVAAEPVPVDPLSTLEDADPSAPAPKKKTAKKAAKAAR